MYLFKVNNEFLTIENDENFILIPVIDVKFVLYMYKTASISNIILEAKKNKRFFKDNKKDSKTVVVTANNDVFVCNQSPLEIAKKCENLGQHMLDVGEGYFVASSYIKVLTDLDSLMVSSLKKNSDKTHGDLQFVHKSEKRKSVILLKTGQLVYLSKDSKAIVNSSVLGEHESTSSD